MNSPLHMNPSPRTRRGRTRKWAFALIALCLLPVSAFAQGIIFGVVQNSNLSNPAVGDLYWVGYLDNTDEEIRIESSTGAGYDGVNWFDDFQNYTTEAAGNPYDFHFINITNGESFHLQSTIPANSFQQEDVVLAATAFPARPSGLTLRPLSGSRIAVSWTYQSGVTWHVYRRATSNNGVFRRIDDPTGNLANPGVADSFFVDATSNGVTDYTYLLIGQNGSGNFSAHSVEVSVLASAVVAPAIASVVPGTGSATGQPTVTITGLGFDPAGATVTFGGTPATNVVVQSPFELTCQVPLGSPGPVDVVVTNTASGLPSAALVGGFVYTANAAPILAAIGPQFVTEGQNLNLPISASDSDLDSLIISALGVPANATFNDNFNGTATFDFNPNYTQANVYNVTFIVSDGLLADTEIVAITVNEAGNQPPVLASIGPQLVAEGQHLEFRIRATDLDNPVLFLSATGVPANAVFTDSTNGAGSFVFDPDFAQQGVYNVTFVASDGTSADTEIVAVTVSEFNLPPVLDPIGPQAVNEGQHLEFRVTASDPDLTIPLLTAVPLPPNAVFVDSGNGAGGFVFDPDYTQGGPIDLAFIASDGVQADTELVTITVSNVNLPPVLAAIGPKVVAEGDTLAISISATDPDFAIPSLTAVGVPANAVFIDSLNGRGGFVFMPSVAQSGGYQVTFIASDALLADTEVVIITVTEGGNQPPVFDSVGPQVINEGDTLTVLVHAVDPEGGAIIMGLVNPIENGVFVDTGNGYATLTYRPNHFQAGTDTVRILAIDNANPPATTTLKFALSTQEKNLPPNLWSIGNRTVLAGDSIKIRVVATDSTAPPGGTMVMTALNLPANATFVDSGNGIGKFKFKPTFGQIGPHNITFVVTDNGNPALADLETVTFTVQSQNRAPVLAAIGPKQVLEGNTLTFNIYASDPDLTLPFLYVDSLPFGATFVDSGNGVGTFRWPTAYFQSGLYGLKFVADDGMLSDYESILIQVTEAGNQPPVLISIGALSVVERQRLTVLIDAFDPDQEIPALEIDTLIENATFVDSGNGTAVFSILPYYTQDSVYTLLFTATDGDLVDSEYVTLTIFDAGNQRPIIEPFNQQITMIENAILLLDVAAHDSDLTIPALSAAPLPSWATFGDSTDGTGQFRFTPNTTSAGVYNFYLFASDADSAALRDSALIQLTVTDLNQPPRIDSLSALSILLQPGQTRTVRVFGSDPNGTIPVLTVSSGLVANMTFVDSANGRGQLTFSPTFAQEAQVLTVSFRAVDSVDPLLTSATSSVTFTVQQRPVPPVLDSIRAKSVVEGTTLQFLVTASDSNIIFPQPTVRCFNYPANVSIDSTLGLGQLRFTFNPSFVQAGVYNVLFQARDLTGQIDTERVAITVIDGGNQPPQFTTIFPIETKLVVPGLLDTLRLAATDIDNPSLTFSTFNTPAGAALTPWPGNLATFYFTPDVSQIGSIYTVGFVVSDGIAADTGFATYQVLAFSRGDVNMDSAIDVLDLAILIDYIFFGGAAPLPVAENGNVNGDAQHDIDAVDLSYLIDFVFFGGPPPPP